MEKLKSAREIALEKAQKLGKLSLEEQRRQKEAESVLLGHGLAEKYLSSRLNLTELQNELSKYEQEQRQLVTRACLERLTESIKLEQDASIEKILEGILLLKPEKKTIEITEKLKEFFEEFNQAEKKARAEIEKAGREILHQLRISGTAIKEINPEARGEWQEKLEKVNHPFKGRLNKLKEKLQTS